MPPLLGALDDQTMRFAYTVAAPRRLRRAGRLLQLIHSRLRFVGTGGYTITELNNERIWLGTSGKRIHPESRKARCTVQSGRNHGESPFGGVLVLRRDTGWRRVHLRTTEHFATTP